jgi:HEPN domain-containing protein
MDDSYVDESLSAAERAFRDTRGQTVETGLDTEDEATVQLRKACRLLTAAQTLDRQNGYYTVIIEASFVAIERSVQAFLLERGYAEPRDLRYGHAAVYDRAAEVNLFSTEFADRLAEHWAQNRADIYYREAPASKEQAEAMLTFAIDVHAYILDFASLSRDCLCD